MPGQWPHISALYPPRRVHPPGHTEIIYLARTEDLRRPAGAPLAGLSLPPSVGPNGTRLAAVRDDGVIGYIEVEILEQATGAALAPPWWG